MLSFIFGNLENIHWWNIADFFVAIAFACILVWGRSNKLFKKKEFNDDFLSLDTMKSLRGFAAIGVILHHISQEQVFQQEGILLPFVNAGAYFVSIFFFASGYGLLKSFNSKPDYLKGFIKKRIVGIVHTRLLRQHLRLSVGMGHHHLLVCGAVGIGSEIGVACLLIIAIDTLNHKLILHNLTHKLSIQVIQI